jgi:hypothetical protein
MSAFGNYTKDEICENIQRFIVEKKQEYPDKNTSEIITELMEVIQYGIKRGLEDIE